jgi:hypothetical protein
MKANANYSPESFPMHIDKVSQSEKEFQPDIKTHVGLESE